MKKYIKPSIEVNKFDAESIMTLSGFSGGDTINKVTTLDAVTNDVYKEYLQDNGGVQSAAADGYVEFAW